MSEKYEVFVDASQETRGHVYMHVYNNSVLNGSMQAQLTREQAQQLVAHLEEILATPDPVEEKAMELHAAWFAADASMPGLQRFYDLAGGPRERWLAVARKVLSDAGAL